MSQVRVISHRKETLRGRYDGKDYVFKPEIPTDIPLAAARHIFGLGLDDKSQAFNQLGWLVPGRDTLESAEAKLEEITFMPGRTVFDDDAPETEDALPVEGAEPQSEPDQLPARARRRTGGRPHVAGPGGEQAADAQASAAANPA
jgi:hypothetical protein